jgi:hypothetical protein
VSASGWCGNEDRSLPPLPSMLVTDEPKFTRVPRRLRATMSHDADVNQIVTRVPKKLPKPQICALAKNSQSFFEGSPSLEVSGRGCANGAPQSQTRPPASRSRNEVSVSAQRPELACEGTRHAAGRVVGAVGPTRERRGSAGLRPARGDRHVVSQSSPPLIPFRPAPRVAFGGRPSSADTLRVCGARGFW